MFPICPKVREIHWINLMERIAILFTFWKNQSDIKFKGGFFWRVILKEKLIVRNYWESRLEKTQASSGRIERQKNGQKGNSTPCLWLTAPVSWEVSSIFFEIIFFYFTFIFLLSLHMYVWGVSVCSHVWAHVFVQVVHVMCAWWWGWCPLSSSISLHWMVEAVCCWTRDPPILPRY